MVAGRRLTASTGPGTCRADPIYAHIGDKIELNGTVPLAEMVYLFVTGPGMPRNGARMDNSNAAVVTGEPETFTQVLVQDDRWSYTWNTGRVSGGLAEGAYTVYVSTSPAAADALSGVKYAEQEVRLTRPITTGCMTIGSTPPGAEVLVNGKFSGLTPLTLQDVAPGNYTVSVEKEGYFTANTTLAVAAGEQARYAPVLLPVAGRTTTPSASVTMPEQTVTGMVVPVTPATTRVPLASTLAPAALAFAWAAAWRRSNLRP